VLGFSRGSILFSFFVESVLLSLLGRHCLGCLLVLPLNGVTTGLMAAPRFSEIAFNFRVTPEDHGDGHRICVGAGRHRRRVSCAHGSAKKRFWWRDSEVCLIKHGRGTEKSANRPQQKRAPASPPNGPRWIFGLASLLFGLGAWAFYAYGTLNASSTDGRSAAREIDFCRPARPTAWCSTPPATSSPRTRSSWPRRWRQGRLDRRG
jgi:hypothetical protein